jgi:hypothetical protein
MSPPGGRGLTVITVLPTGKITVMFCWEFTATVITLLAGEGVYVEKV